MPEKVIPGLKLLLRWRANVAQFAFDHFGFVPDAWQLEVFQAWDRGDKRIAMAACKGPGKTAVLAILMWQFLFTRRQSKVGATSISGDNLQDCLWAELAKWQLRSPMLMAAFEWQKTRIVAKDLPEAHFATARKWSKEADATAQADTLAGLHADYILFVIDECGGVPDSVAVSAEACLSGGKESRMLIAGNTTQCEGPLWRACGSEKHLWTTVHITGDPDDQKRSPRVSPEWARQQIAAHGAENPWVLANVFGRFPPSSSLNFIGLEFFNAAVTREAVAGIEDAFVIGVDVARFGSDESVIFFRKGLDARHWPAIRYRGIETTELAARVAQYAREYSADAVFVDGGGVGGGVVDRLRQLRVPGVIEVQFGGKSDRITFGEATAVYDNKAAEMWGHGREWMKHGALPEDNQLRKECTERRYFYNQRYGRDAIALESKEDMMKRGLESPNMADAFFLTFAWPVTASRRSGGIPGQERRTTDVQSEYDPFSNERMAA